jgi:hypothetical protein
MVSLPRQEAPSRPLRPRRPPATSTLWIGGAVLLWLLYAFVFVGTGRARPGEALVDGFANVLPVAGLAVAVRALLKAEVMRRSTPAQVVWHAALAIGFSFTWYATLMVLLALLSGVRGGSFALIGFSGPALTWQIFQGLILYAAIAAVCYAVRGGRDVASVTLISPPAAPQPLARYLIRKGEDLTPVEASDIITITGAQDYAEVATLRDRHLVRLSLTEFEARLDLSCFVRVHRSSIINLKHLDRIEPAGGGRLIAHMENGERVQVSRTGAQALKRFAV